MSWKTRLFPLLPFALAATAMGQAGGWVEQEGCFCGYQTGLVRDYVVKGNGDAAAKQAGADAIQGWNRLGKLFDVSIDGSGQIGSANNGVNELNVFIDPSDQQAVYGLTLESGVFGVAMIYPEPAFGDFNECVDFKGDGCAPFSETDVLINSAFETGWTTDWYAKLIDRSTGGPGLVFATSTHEVGHTLGFHHIFQLPQSRSFSVMNYANHDARRFVTRIDAKTFRTVYQPLLNQDLVDLSIVPFTWGQESYGHRYAEVSNPNPAKGETIQVGPWLGQVVGNRPAPNVVVHWLLWPAGSRGYPDVTDYEIGQVVFGGVEVDTEQELTTDLTIPQEVPDGAYHLGAIVTVGGQEDSPFEPGRPTNNRFAIGHDELVVINVRTDSDPSSGRVQGLFATFDLNPSSPRAGQLVQLVDKSPGGPTAWSWSFGDPASGAQNTSTVKNPSHVFAEPGTYTVSLNVTSGSKTKTASKQVTVQAGVSLDLTRVVPIVLDVAGRGGVRFSSELTLTNRGTKSSTVDLQYTAASALGAVGTGTVSESLPPGRQLVIGDAIAYLRGKGLAIPADGSGQGGSVRVTFRGLSASDAGFAGARTTAPSASGRAGLAYPGPSVDKITAPKAYVFGLRETPDDRANLAIVNAGTSGSLQLKVTVYSADGRSADVPVEPLGPGQWRQVNSVLQVAGGFTNGYAVVERVSGSDPFVAYATVVSNGTSDGSYLEAIPVNDLTDEQVVPVVVETPTFESELVVANPSRERLTAYLVYVESVASKGSLAIAKTELAPGEQQIFPGLIDAFRHTQGVTTIGPKGATYAGGLGVFFVGPRENGVGAYAGVRTGARASSGGQYGLFYSGVGFTSSATDAWIYGLAQDDKVRSNLAILNVGVNGNPIVVKMEIYDGDTGLKVAERDLDVLADAEWRQINGVLGNVRNGYVHLVRLSGNDSFVAYGVVNDGATSSSGTNDGSYVAMTVSR